MSILFPGSLDTNSSLLTAVNGLVTTLDGVLNADANGNQGSAVNIQVASTTDFPTAGYIIVGNATEGYEVIAYTGKDATHFTGITRASDGTVAIAHATGVDVKNGINAAYHNLLRDAIIAIENEMYEAGDLKYRTSSTVTRGRWLLLDGKTIGDASSSATGRANADTETLFTLLWTNCANAECPVSGGRGASAAADFAAHKTLTLPDARGLALSVAGTNSILQDANSGYFTRTLGKKENDQEQGHYHKANQINYGAGAAFGIGNGAGADFGASNDTNNTKNAQVMATDGTNGTPRIGVETRMANIAAGYLFIKY